MFFKEHKKKKQHSHSSQDFKGTNTVHKDTLLPVYSGHEISHVVGYDPRFPSEVGLFVDHYLETKNGMSLQSWCTDTL